MRTGAFSSPAIAFNAVLGRGRGRGECAPIMRAGNAGEAELQRLCALLDNKDYEEPLTVLREQKHELLPELSPHINKTAKHGKAFEHMLAQEHWRILNALWPCSRRILRNPYNRVEALFTHYIRGCECGRLAPDSHYERILTASTHFHLVPQRFLASTIADEFSAAALTVATRRHLQILLPNDFEGARTPAAHVASALPYETFDVWGALMAEWTLEAGTETVLVYALGQEGKNELYQSLEGLNGHAAAWWLSEPYMPFFNWQEAYSNCLHASSFPEASEFEDWGPKAREELFAWLAGIPDNIYG